MAESFREKPGARLLRVFSCPDSLRARLQALTRGLFRDEKDENEMENEIYRHPPAGWFCILEGQLCESIGGGMYRRAGRTGTLDQLASEVRGYPVNACKMLKLDITRASFSDLPTLVPIKARIESLIESLPTRTRETSHE